MIQQKYSFLLASSSKRIKHKGHASVKAFYQITSSFHCPFTQACWNYLCPSLVILEADSHSECISKLKDQLSKPFFYWGLVYLDA
jgi:hypothetical protein